LEDNQGQGNLQGAGVVELDVQLGEVANVAHGVAEGLVAPPGVGNGVPPAQEVVFPGVLLVEGHIDQGVEQGAIVGLVEALFVVLFGPDVRTMSSHWCVNWAL
jgi:hypothetical protein